MDFVTHPRADELFASIMFQFRQALAFMLRHGLSDALYLPADGRVLRLVKRFKWLAERYRAGTLVAPRARAAGGARARRPRPADVLPRRFGWLCVLSPAIGYRQLNASACGGQLAYVIQHNADMRAMIASDPRFGRVLRPLLYALGRHIGPELALLAPPPRRARTPRPPPPEADSRAASAPVSEPASPPEHPERSQRRARRRGLNPVTGLAHPDPFFRG